MKIKELKEVEKYLSYGMSELSVNTTNLSDNGSVESANQIVRAEYYLQIAKDKLEYGISEIKYKLASVGDIDEFKINN